MGSRFLDQLHDGETGDGLPAAAFPDHAQRAAARDIKGDAIYGAYNPLLRKKIGFEVLDF
jgi:hypothetical protein